MQPIMQHWDRVTARRELLEVLKLESLPGDVQITSSSVDIHVILEILDCVSEVLKNTLIRIGKSRLSEVASKRLLQAELLKIAVSSEDLRETIDSELEELRTQIRQPNSLETLSSLVIPRCVTEAEKCSSVSQGILLDDPVLAAESVYDDHMSWMNTSLVTPIHKHVRQRSYSYPFALGILARCVIQGTPYPHRLRNRSKSLNDVPFHDKH